MSSYKIRYALFTVAMVSIGSASILVRLSGASAISCAFWRLLLSIPLLFVMSIANGVKPLYTPSFLRYFIPSGVALALHFILWMDSLFRIPIAISTTIVVTYPIHLLLLEGIISREIPRGREIVGVTIAFVGIAIFFSDAYTNAEIDVIGILESFMASILAALYFQIGRIARKFLNVYSYTIPTYFFGALTVAIYNYIFVRDDMLHQFLSSWIWLLLLAVIPMIGGHTVMNYLLRYFKSSIVTSIALAEPIIATVLAIPLLAEVPSPNQIIALIVTLSGVVTAITSSQT
ncbi:MAG: DMT family transporter [Ignisphaera sp.]|uniref:DMT family transporter n=1 Tax=Ignisphaera aggregans TaxID=334771 RepID=A0A7J3JRE8_9CREN